MTTEANQPTVRLTIFRLGDLGVLAVSPLKRAARFLPINFPQDYRLLAILDCDWVARVKFITASRGLCGRITDENLTAPGI